MNTTQVPGDKLKKALTLLTELSEQYPDKSRKELLRQIETKLDLSPLECEFLHKNFSDTSPK
jgi:hypothetical protein